MSSNPSLKIADWPVQARLAHLRFYGDAFLLDTRSGAFFRLSSSAIYILKEWAAGCPAHELPAALLARYGIEAKTALRDIERLTDELVALGIFSHEPARLP